MQNATKLLIQIEFPYKNYPGFSEGVSPNIKPSQIPLEIPSLLAVCSVISGIYFSLILMI